MVTLSEKMALTRAEKLAVYDFAVHLARCEQCLANRSALCAAGIALRDASINAARALAKVDADADFAKRYPNLIA